MIDLKLLRQAMVLAKHRNFARAAQALHVTQPALSRSIAGLEATVGEKLFNRTKQGVEPTAFGELVLARGGSLLEGARELERSIALMRGLDVGELRVGVGPYPAELSVGEAVGRLLSRHPALRIEVSTTDLRSLADSVLRREFDLAVVDVGMSEGETVLAFEPLPERPVQFFCRTGHPLLAEPGAGLERILQFPYVGTRLPARVARSFFALAKIGTIDSDTGDYLPPVRADTLQMAKQVVMASDAVGAAPMILIAREVEAGQLAALSWSASWLRLHYGFLYRRDRMLSPAAEAFIAEVRAVEARIVTEEQRLHATFDTAHAGAVLGR